MLKSSPLPLKTAMKYSILLPISWKALENLPSYDITPKATKCQSMKNSDIDENIINNLNSRY